MAATFAGASGCPVSQQRLVGNKGCQEKYWNDCLGKDAIIVQSSQQSSAWSTQDGYLAYVDADRDASIECAQDTACHSSWPVSLQGRLDQDFDATCTSRSSDAFAKDGLRHKSDGAANVDFEQANRSDADAHPDVTRSKQQQTLSPAEQQRLRAAHQLEDLLAMIRNEQALEQDLCASCGFLEQQDTAVEQPITPQMLMIVSSWLAEVAFEFSMQQETLFLAVGLLSRFLDSSTGVPRGVLQLVAVACMMLAAKQDEVVHPSVQELTDIAANCFTTQDLLRMERILLDSLSWRVKTPTAYTFLHLYTQSTAAVRSTGGLEACQATPAAAAAVSASSPVRTTDPLSGAVVAKAAYLTELALLDYGMLEFRPSMVAAGALLLSQTWSPQGASVDEVQAISGFSAGELQACMERLVRLHQYAEAAEGFESLTPLIFIKEKYAQSCWLKASMQTIPADATTHAGAGHFAAPAQESGFNCADGVEPMQM